MNLDSLKLREHHRESVANLIRLLEQDESFRAIILSGSIAQGVARDDSDIDVYLVVTDEEFQKRKRDHSLCYYDKDVCTYPEGYIDGKIINYAFLESALERGSEPTRASFIGSRAVFSRIPGIDSLLQQIPVYPEVNREQNLKDFYAQVLLYGKYFAARALDQNNPYLLSQSLSNVVLFAGRLILAYNRILFPCHKSFMRAVEGAPDKPVQYVQQVHELLADPTKERMLEFVETIGSFQDWGITYHQAVSLFVANNEWNWIDAPPPLQDR
ncbi:nucleotidyltransferase domain-containing protein [Paenibacillus rigui]|uniref:Polymerase nucleotidyl transferase domain-containing protein n=1 Tax=Paenibacillus rigui TaxID=554312 RepID=A0A229UH97_9BACL|nr:nucleotidyltransferase domain-containing protein [Paenibacillus rigui]OXM82767.1 hypothetical protein CF651_29310 [Paenibacillus rigui]